MYDDMLEVRSYSCVAVIVAGGRGSRFGSDVPKQLVSLAGHPILHHTLRRFEQAASITKIIVVANEDWEHEIADISNYALRKTPYQVVCGGNSRNESVACAVEALSDSAGDTRVLIHDGVRPFASEDIILRVTKALGEYRAVIPVIPSADPLLRIDAERVTDFEQRSQVVRGQSPQGFLLRDLRMAFASYLELPDFGTLFELLLSIDPELCIGYVDGDPNNIKITTPIDRLIAGQIIMDGIA